jgi:hypothetical protein
MLAMDGIIQSVGRGLRLYGPRGKRCHVFLPVYGRSAGGGGGGAGGGGGGSGEGEGGGSGEGEVENGDDDWDDDVDYVEEEALLVVEAWLESLDEATRKNLEKEDGKLEKAHAIARTAVEHIAGLGLGPQDMRQIGVLCGPSEGGGGGGSSVGLLSARDIPGRVERRAVGKGPADEESRRMVDVLNAGTDGGGGANPAAAGGGSSGLAEAIFRVATRTFSGVGRVRLGWMRTYRKVEAYAKEHGTVPPRSHPELGDWVNNQREAKRGTGTGKMTEARIRLLGSIKNAQGEIVWMWDVDDERWMEKYLKLVAYVEEHGTVPPISHPELGRWVVDQRLAKRGKGQCKMTPERIALLDGIENAQGERVWVWDVDGEAQWMASRDALVDYMDVNEEMPTTAKSDKKLARWMGTQRGAKRGTKKGKMPEERIQQLEALPGWTWEGPYPSPAEMKNLIAAARENGTFPPPRLTGRALDPEAVEATGKTAPGSVASAATPQGEARAAQVEVETGVETAPEVASKKRRKDSTSTSGPALGNEALAAETAQVSELKEQIKRLEERVKSLEDALAARTDEQTNCGKGASSPPENLSSGDGRSPSSKRPRTTTTPAWWASSVRKRRRRTIESDSSDDDDDDSM